eukprot:GHVU01171785.1.p1 GENE.GHVU01171785.1~~GHVU01171785.1.p1  ORF type:complete len:446 (+),score=21.05 GHVU01171785.1:432-1769(+)
MGGAPTQVTIADALSEVCIGAASISDLDGNRRLFAGTDSTLNELSGTTWGDVSKGAGYDLGAEDRWAFIGYGDAILAATPTEVIQAITSGDFDDISGAPKAKLIESAKGFAVAFNTDSYGDEWYCSAYLDYTDWNLDVATQCVKGRLIGGSGPLTAARRFGDNICAYKAGAIFVGTYVGAPEVWRWDQASTDVGCVGQDAVVDTAYGHFFVGRDNVYLFDGTTPKPICNGVIREWLFADMNPTFSYQAMCLWERPKARLWIFYPSNTSVGGCDRCVVHHVPSKRWGIAHQSVEAICSSAVPTITYDAGAGNITTYDSGPPIPFDSSYWVSGQISPAVFNTSHVLSALIGSCLTASFTTGDFGLDDRQSYCDALFVRYTHEPTLSQGTGYARYREGGPAFTGATVAWYDGQHPMDQSARFHRFKVDPTHDFVVTGVAPRLKDAGRG